MNIVIVGCGKVGTTLTEHLVKEGHNVSVIDKNPEVIRKITEAYDVFGIVGNGATHAVQLEAGIKEADLMIAVTIDDELNLLCCLIAKKASSCNTIARVRNPDYLTEKEFFKEKLGLSRIINPEYEAASEMARLFCIPSAIEVDSFADGKVEMMKMVLPENSPIANQPIMEALGKLSGKALICAVERNGEVAIPTGSFNLQVGDEISFIANPHDSEHFFKKAGLDSYRIKRILIVGGGKITYYLVSMLLDYGFKVKIIEKDKERCDFLSAAFPSSVIVINGDGTDEQVLYEEGIDRVDGFASLTNNDEENIMLSLFVKDRTKAKIITKIDRSNFESIVEKLEIGSVVSPKLVTAEKITSYARALGNSQGNNVQTLYKIVGDKAEALEFNVRSSSEATGTPLADLELINNLLVCCSVRNGRASIPNGMTTIEPGDTVIVVTTQTGLNDLSDIVK